MGKSLTMIGYSSELPEMVESRKLTTVVRSRSLQKNDPHYYPVVPCTALRVLTLTVPC